MKLTLAVDMDEVIADPITKLRQWYEEEYGIRFSEEDIRGRDLKHAADPKHFYLFHQYLNTPGFFRDLAVMPGAKETLQQLNEKYELYIVSAAMEFPNSLKDKYDWLAEHFPFIGWRQICLCGSKSIIQADIIIDDRTRNFSHFKGRKLLYTAHHNVFETAYERVNNWQEIAGLLL
jgi:5'(3')-deoxyribonucleotidase